MNVRCRLLLLFVCILFILTACRTQTTRVEIPAGSSRSIVLAN
jgi:hypothetical protein